MIEGKTTTICRTETKKKKNKKDPCFFCKAQGVCSGGSKSRDQYEPTYYIGVHIYYEKYMESDKKDCKIWPAKGKKKSKKSKKSKKNKKNKKCKKSKKNKKSKKCKKSK